MDLFLQAEQGFQMVIRWKAAAVSGKRLLNEVDLERIFSEAPCSADY